MTEEAPRKFIGPPSLPPFLHNSSPDGSEEIADCGARCNKAALCQAAVAFDAQPLHYGPPPPPPAESKIMRTRT